MNLDAPQLERVESAVADDGSACQFRLTNRAGDQIAFQVSLRHFEYLLQPIRTAAGQMQERLLANEQAAAAEMIATIAEPRPIVGFNCMQDGGTGDALLVLQTEEAGAMTLRLPRALSRQIAAVLAQLDPPAGALKH